MSQAGDNADFWLFGYGYILSRQDQHDQTTIDTVTVAGASSGSLLRTLVCRMPPRHESVELLLKRCQIEGYRAGSEDTSVDFGRYETILPNLGVLELLCLFQLVPTLRANLGPRRGERPIGICC